MMKRIGNLLLALGLCVLLYAGYLFYDFYQGSDYQLEEAEAYLAKHAKAHPKHENPADDNEKHADKNYKATKGEVFAIIEIPKISLKLPIIEGTDPKLLKYGVGHADQTWLPGQGNQIFLAGHNDSAFLDIGKLKKGDEIRIHMPYGAFSYEMTGSEIVNEGAVDKIGSMDEETLVLMTCYPFYSILPVKERYLLYAKPL